MRDDTIKQVKTLQEGIGLAFEQAAGELEKILPEAWQAAMALYQDEGQAAQALLKPSMYFNQQSPAEYASQSKNHETTVADYYDGLVHGVYH